MDSSQRVGAAISYIPVLGWLVLLTQRNNKFAIFHLRQAIGLGLYLALIFVIWAAFTWVISWIPFGFLIGNALFALVLATYIYGVIALISGIVNASRGRPSIMPIFGEHALRLPIGSLQ